MRNVFITAAALTFVLFTVNFYLLGFGVISDGLGYYSQLRSAVFDRDLRVDNEYEVYTTSASKFGGGIRWTAPIPEYSQYPIGLGLILSPFFFAGHLAAHALNSVGMEVTTDGFSWPYEYLYCTGSILFGLAGLALCFLAARRYFGSRAALLATAGVWFASPLTFYLTLEPSMSHAVSQFLVSLFIYACLTCPWKTSLRHTFLMGALLGLSALVRPQNMLFGIVPAALMFIGNPTHVSFARKFWMLGLMAGVSVLALTPQLIAYHLSFGGIQNSPYLQAGQSIGQRSSFDWLHPKPLATLFSGYHGLFSWHPLLLAGVAGLLLAWRSFKAESTALLLAFVLQLYLIASWYCWWQGASFGGRMFCNCSFVFVFGLAALWRRFPGTWGRRMVVAVTLLCMGWNVLLVMQFESGLIPAEQPLTHRELIAGQFQALPHFVHHVMQRQPPNP